MSIKEDISSLTHQVQALTYESMLKEEKIKTLEKETKKEKEQIGSLKYRNIYILIYFVSS